MRFAKYGACCRSLIAWISCFIIVFIFVLLDIDNFLNCQIAKTNKGPELSSLHCFHVSNTYRVYIIMLEKTVFHKWIYSCLSYYEGHIFCFLNLKKLFCIKKYLVAYRSSKFGAASMFTLLVLDSCLRQTYFGNLKIY